jgi:DNA-binding GntR family transcriptional regulator
MSVSDIGSESAVHSAVKPRSSRGQIRRQVLADELINRVRDMILDGELRPGGRISMQRLCGRFGVSRTPLREALKVLAAEGLVLLLPNRSAVVERITRQKIDELVPLVGALEVLAGQLACVRIDKASLATIEALHERLIYHFNERDAKSYMDCSDAILKMVFAAAANETVTKIHETLIKRLRWHRVASNAPPEWDKAVEEQGHMLRALQVGDGDLWALAVSRFIRHRAVLLHQGVDRTAEGRAHNRVGMAFKNMQAIAPKA